MQAQLDKEDADLNEARLRIADSHLQYDKSGVSDDARPDRVHALAAAALDAAEPARSLAGRHVAARRGMYGWGWGWGWRGVEGWRGGGGGEGGGLGGGVYMYVCMCE
jgi:hypothetical protein